MDNIYPEWLPTAFALLHNALAAKFKDLGWNFLISFGHLANLQDPGISWLRKPSLLSLTGNTKEQTLHHENYI